MERCKCMYELLQSYRLSVDIPTTIELYLYADRKVNLRTRSDTFEFCTFVPAPDYSSGSLYTRINSKNFKEAFDNLSDAYYITCTLCNKTALTKEDLYLIGCLCFYSNSFLVDFTVFLATKLTFIINSYR